MLLWLVVIVNSGDSNSNFKQLKDINPQENVFCHLPRTLPTAKWAEVNSGWEKGHLVEKDKIQLFLKSLRWYSNLHLHFVLFMKPLVLCLFPPDGYKTPPSVETSVFQAVLWSRSLDWASVHSDCSNRALDEVLVKSGLYHLQLRRPRTPGSRSHQIWSHRQPHAWSLLGVASLAEGVQRLHWAVH